MNIRAQSTILAALNCYALKKPSGCAECLGLLASKENPVQILIQILLVRATFRLFDRLDQGFNFCNRPISRAYQTVSI